MTNSIDIAKSEVQLLKDFICVKLYKQEDEQWRDLGYDIANFTVPKTGQIKSNYLKSAEPEVPDTPAATSTEESKEEDAKPEKTAEDLAREKRERIESAMHRARHAAVSFMNLSCETIYGIH